MSTLGNIIWFLVGGIWQGLAWTIAGVLWSITIIGIPIGQQCFKLARIAFFPFGKRIEYENVNLFSTIANVIWLIVSGIPLAITAIVNGLILCITIIGIPFGLQCFKFAKLALMPFGAKIYSE